MTNPVQNDSHPVMGFAQNILGKAFAIASAAALCLPLLGISQAAGIAPGGLGSPDYQNIDTLLNTFNRPAYTQVEQQQTATPPVNQVGDTAISFFEGVGAVAIAGVAGGVATAFADARQKRAESGTLSMLKEVGLLLGDTGADISKATAEQERRNWSNSPAMAGSGAAGGAMAGAFVLAVASVFVPTYLSVKSVYDNFIRKPDVPAGMDR